MPVHATACEVTLAGVSRRSYRLLRVRGGGAERVSPLELFFDLVYIGHERQFGAEPSEEIKSRFYDNMGNTLDYVYELEGDTLTIWGGERGSPAYYRGTFGGDGDTLSGAWHYPGGGYEAIPTRVG